MVRRFIEIADSASRQLLNLKRACRLVWNAGARYTAVWALLLVVQGMLPAATVYLSKLLVDALVDATTVSRDWQHMRYAGLIAVVIATTMLVSEATRSIVEWTHTALSDLAQDYIKKLIHEKAASVDMVLYETPEYHDRLEQANNEASSRPMALLDNLGALAQNGITFLMIMALLVSYSIWLPALLIIAMLPAFYVVLRFDSRYHRWWKKTTEMRRWTQYYDQMLTAAFAAAEMRLFNCNRPFRDKYQNLRTELREERLRQMRKQGIAKFGTSVGALAVGGALLFWMGRRVMQGLLTLGDLALFYQAFSRGQGLMRTLLGSAGSFYRNVLYLEALFEFLDMESTIKETSTPTPLPERLRHGIAYKNVTFRYPGSSRAVLQDFSLFIPAGKIVVIVGANGAGKTTLQKLLCRFYDPEAGCIELDGIDLRDLASHDLWRFIAITFQLPLAYHAVVRDIIALGDWQAQPTHERIEKAARGAGADEFISSLPQKYDTMLGKVISNGTDLSGGQWQRLALARSYLRQAPLILLDEPTSFMDAWSEADWFDRFRSLSNDRTAIIITHRFTIAMRADIIHVMDAGRIVETGTHQELLALGGRYAQSWKTQMQIGSDLPDEDEPTEPEFIEPLELEEVRS